MMSEKSWLKESLSRVEEGANLLPDWIVAFETEDADRITHEGEIEENDETGTT